MNGERTSGVLKRSDWGQKAEEQALTAQPTGARGLCATRKRRPRQFDDARLRRRGSTLSSPSHLRTALLSQRHHRPSVPSTLRHCGITALIGEQRARGNRQTCVFGKEQAAQEAEHDRHGGAA